MIILIVDSQTGSQKTTHIKHLLCLGLNWSSSTSFQEPNLALVPRTNSRNVQDVSSTLSKNYCTHKSVKIKIKKFYFQDQINSSSQVDDTYS